MATTEILQFAGGGGANVSTQADYAAMTSLLANGFQSGEVHSDVFNKVIRQCNFIATGLAQFIVNSGISVPDNADVATLAANISSAIVAAAGGGVSFASNAEAQAMTSTTKIISPSTLKTANQGSNQSLAATGYQKLPGGLILQWGITPDFVAEGGQIITLPITFPTAIWSATATLFIPSATNNYDQVAQVYSLSTSSIGIYAQVVYTSITWPVKATWFAIGY